jgi:histidine triad (HIT) family protein
MSESASQSDCLFCKIRDGRIPSKKVFEDAECFAFRDINPQAPTHVLVAPRRHLATLNDLRPGADEALVGHLHLVAAQIARDEGHAESGWRTVFNVNRGAGQTVFHIHLHVLGGRPLGWPPG